MSDQEQKHFDMQLQVSGKYNGCDVRPAEFSVPMEVARDDPHYDVVVTATLPDPKEVFPDSRIDLDDWILINAPWQSYVGPADNFTLGCCPYDSGLLPNCGNIKNSASSAQPVSPEGLSEVLAMAWDSGEILQGITDLNYARKRVNYQFNAQFKDKSLPRAHSSIPTVGMFSFPATERGRPIRAHGRIGMFDEAGKATEAEFNGLVLFKDRLARLEAPFSMSKITHHYGLKIVMKMKFLPFSH